MHGQTVDLLPLEHAHFAELQALAADKSIWEFYAYNPADPDIFLKIYTAALSERISGDRYPFVIYHKAHERIGGQFEGILRNDMIRDNGTNRNSAYFSIIEQEWTEKKLKILELLRSNHK